MKSELVCKIEVRTEEGKESWGSGYPTTPNRIITAAHVVVDAARIENEASEGDAHDIRLSFGPAGKMVKTPVYLEWLDDDVDVAVLRCELPDEFRPTHRLLTKPRTNKTDWEAKGFTVYGSKNRPNGMDDFHGRFASFAEDSQTLALEAANAPLEPEQWKGGSGSVAFEEKTQTALAVITEYAGGKKLDELIGVPICYLLNSEATKDEFRSAIQFPEDPDWDEYCQHVTKDVVAKLKTLEGEIGTIAREIRQLAGGDASGIDLASEKETLAEKTGSCIVHHKAVAEVLVCLIDLMHGMEQVHKNTLADIVDRILPLNYVPELVQRLHQLKEQQFGLVEGEASTWSLAEIIMAGYDQAPTRFKIAEGTIQGLTAKDYDEGPEVGPGEIGAEMTGVLPAVRDVLYHLLIQKDVRARVVRT